MYHRFAISIVVLGAMIGIAARLPAAALAAQDEAIVDLTVGFAASTIGYNEPFTHSATVGNSGSSPAFDVRLAVYPPRTYEIDSVEPTMGVATQMVTRTGARYFVLRIESLGSFEEARLVIHGTTRPPRPHEYDAWQLIATTSSQDDNPFSNYLTTDRAAAYRPRVDSVEERRTADGALRLVITGAHFSESVEVGFDTCGRWGKIRRESDTVLIVYGRGLKSCVPLHVPVQVSVVNSGPLGTTFTYTRSGAAGFGPSN
jgi:hypothetical protein